MSGFGYHSPGGFTFPDPATPSPWGYTASPRPSPAKKAKAKAGPRPGAGSDTPKWPTAANLRYDQLSHVFIHQALDRISPNFFHPQIMMCRTDNQIEAAFALAYGRFKDSVLEPAFRNADDWHRALASEYESRGRPLTGKSLQDIEREGMLLIQEHRATVAQQQLASYNALQHQHHHHQLHSLSHAAAFPPGGPATGLPQATLMQLAPPGQATMLQPDGPPGMVATQPWGASQLPGSPAHLQYQTMNPAIPQHALQQLSAAAGRIAWPDPAQASPLSTAPAPSIAADSMAAPSLHAATPVFMAAPHLFAAHPPPMTAHSMPATPPPTTEPGLSAAPAPSTTAAPSLSAAPLPPATASGLSAAPPSTAAHNLSADTASPTADHSLPAALASSNPAAPVPPSQVLFRDHATGAFFLSTFGRKRLLSIMATDYKVENDIVSTETLGKSASVYELLISTDQRPWPPQE